jgi:hypothetical protein
VSFLMVYPEERGVSDSELRSVHADLVANGDIPGRRIPRWPYTPFEDIEDIVEAINLSGQMTIITAADEEEVKRADEAYAYTRWLESE